jgi:hypothetical protein
MAVVPDDVELPQLLAKAVSLSSITTRAPTIGVDPESDMTLRNAPAGCPGAKQVDALVVSELVLEELPVS